MTVQHKTEFDSAVDWLRENAAFMYERPVAALQAFLAGDDSADSASRLIPALGALASWYSNELIRAVVAEPAVAASRAASIYFDCVSLEFKLRIANIARRTAANGFRIPDASLLGVLARDASLAVCAGFAIGATGEARAFLASLDYCRRAGWLVGADQSIVFPFILRAANGPGGLGEFNIAGLAPLPNCYRELLAAGDSDSFADALGLVADYRRAQSGEDTNTRNYQFSRPLWRLWPAEVVALIKLREWRGVEIHDDGFDPAFTRAGLAYLPDQFPEFAEIRVKARRAFGDFHEPFDNIGELRRLKFVDG